MESFFSGSYGDFLAKQDTRKDDFIEKPPRRLNMFGILRQNELLNEGFLRSNVLAEVSFKSAFNYPQNGKISFRSALLREPVPFTSRNSSATKSRANSSLVEESDKQVREERALSYNHILLKTSLNNSLELQLKVGNREPAHILISSSLPYFENIKIYANIRQNLFNSEKPRNYRKRNHIKFGAIIANNKINANFRLTARNYTRLFETRINMTLGHLFYFGLIGRANLRENFLDELGLLVNYKKDNLDIFLEHRSKQGLQARKSRVAFFSHINEKFDSALFFVLKGSNKNQPETWKSKFLFVTSYKHSQNLNFKCKFSTEPYFQSAMAWKMNKYMELGLSTLKIPSKLANSLLPLRLGVKIKTY